MASYDDTATVSGSVVSIDNGADEVGTKSCVVTVSPTLSGVSSVVEKQTRRNLLLPSNADIAETTVNGIKRSYSLDNQEFTFDGTNTKTDAAWLILQINTSDFVLNGLKTGVTYRFSHNLTADMYAQLTYNKSGGGIGGIGYLRGNAGRNASVSFTLPSDFSSLRQFQIGVVNTATDVNITAHFQIELGSTAHDYESYQTPTVYTASLGRTIYGGEVDIVNGTAEPTNIFDSSNPYETGKYISNVVSGVISYQGNVNYNIYRIEVSNDVTISGIKANGPWWIVTDLEDNVLQSGQNNGGTEGRTFSLTIPEKSYLYLSVAVDGTYKCDDILQVEYGASASAYSPYFEPFTFTGQEVPTKLGYNAFWNDEGNTELTYYKSGYGFTSVTIHKETPDGEPVSQTVKFHKVIYGGQADVVKGTCEPKNLAEFSNADNVNRDSFSYTTEKPELIEWTKTGSGGKFYARFILHIPKPGKYTISCTNDSTVKAKYIYSDELWGTSVYSSVSTNPFVAEFSASGNYVMGFYAGSSATSGTLGEVMCEEGETQTSYAPYFAPFSFPPINMETDEGENTLYAGEGDSAITYRKDTE